MKHFIFYCQIFFKEPKWFGPLLASLFFNSLIWFLIIWRLPASANWIPLYYNVYFGIGWIGPWIQAIYYPLLALIIIIINFLLGSLTYEKNLNLTRWLLWSSLLVQLIILTVVISLIINYFS